MSKDCSFTAALPRKLKLKTEGKLTKHRGTPLSSKEVKLALALALAPPLPPSIFKTLLSSPTLKIDPLNFFSAPCL